MERKVIISLAPVKVGTLFHFYHFLAMVTQKLRMKGVRSSAMLCQFTGEELRNDVGMLSYKINNS